MEKVVINLFDEYYNKKGKYKFKQNPEREKNRIFKLFVDNDNKTFDDIDDKIKNNKQLSLLMLDFYKYLKEEYQDIKKYHHDSDLGERYMYDTVDRQLEIAKFLHTKPTKDKIIDEFRISDKTLKNDLDTLKNGLVLQKNCIKLNFDYKDGYLNCSSTVHPVFLPLNLTEVYALVRTLPILLETSNIDKERYEFILNIIERVKCQLSDYALNIIFDDNKDEIERIRKINLNQTFVEEKQLEVEEKSKYIYYLKHHIKCKFEIEGKVVLGYVSPELDGIVSENGSVLFNNLILSKVFIGPVDE